ncbi:MAG TPA: S53 family peptidase [Candidatus Dormibacteraeota bacterium]|nr:S53 family peptidase [Candidatus Dormibacteraeota bacterium]
MSPRSLLCRAGIAALGVAASASVGGSPGRAASPVVLHPTVAEYYQETTGTTPPTEAQCQAEARRCFTPQAIQSAYDLGPLYARGLDGAGVTIAIVDSFGSDTIAHDLHVFDQAFGLQPMCGEEGVTCATGMPTFSQLSINGTPATKAPPSQSKGTGLEARSAWALEVSLDVETSHAIAPMANILLVTTPTAETLGVQGFPDMMKAEKYVVDNHLANVISQSFGASEGAFGSPQSLLNLRDAYVDAAQNGVTVLASSGDNGTATISKSPVKNQPTIPIPEAEWPASDPLVTAVGGTYLCTDPTATTNEPRTITGGPPPKCMAFPTQSEVGWTFSGGGFSRIFGAPAYQASLPAGSTPIGSMRGLPDVAFQASAGAGALVYVSLPPDGQSSNVVCNGAPCTTGWYDIGGTSLSCPQWAGIVAIADQLNGRGLGLINPALYKLGSNPTTYANDFFDVTTGKNQTDPSIPGYPATTGWDPVTGLGTPNAANLVPDLVAASR